MLGSFTLPEVSPVVPGQNAWTAFLIAESVTLKGYYLAASANKKQFLVRSIMATVTADVGSGILSPGKTRGASMASFCQRTVELLTFIGIPLLH